jgi:hypothetical protein
LEKAYKDIKKDNTEHKRQINRRSGKYCRNQRKTSLVKLGLEVLIERGDLP